MIQLPKPGELVYLVRAYNTEAIQVRILYYNVNGSASFNNAMYEIVETGRKGMAIVEMIYLTRQGHPPPQRFFKTKVIADYSAFLWAEYIKKVIAAYAGR